jgi:pimeloyl-ACP methyl ester carboxylesterase
MSARSWTNQLQGLAPALAVMAIDLPGHGESDPASEATVESYADAAAGLLDALGAGPVVVAGHSLGGAVAVALAARHPELVKALVLISSCAKLPANNGRFERLLSTLPAPIRRFVFFSASKKALFSPGAPIRGVQLGLKDLRSCPPETVRKDVAAAQAMDLEAAAHGLRVPALILCGTQDRLTPVALSEQLRDLIPDSRLQLVERAGHMLPLEAPERVNQEILDFVESVVERKMCRPVLPGHATRRALVRRFIDKVWALCRGKSRPSESLPVPGRP